MPLYEQNYEGVKSRGGERAAVPPSSVLLQMGPLLQVAISVTPEHAKRLSHDGAKPPDPITGYALIDTGASITAVDEGVCQQLGLSSTGVVKMSHAGGEEERMCYPIQVIFPGSPFPAMTNPRVVSCTLGNGHLLLFGRDLLSRIRMVYNGPAGRVELAF